MTDKIRIRDGAVIVPRTDGKSGSKKVWMTFQVERGFRDEANAAADRLGINLSKFLRGQVKKLIEASKKGRAPKVTEALSEEGLKEFEKTATVPAVAKVPEPVIDPLHLEN